MINQTSILQFNCGLANFKETKPIFDAVSSATHQVLAVQKPRFSRHSGNTYCSKGYTLTLEGDNTTKVCFMISKEFIDEEIMRVLTDCEAC